MESVQSSIPHGLFNIATVSQETRKGSHHWAELPKDTKSIILKYIADNKHAGDVKNEDPVKKLSDRELDQAFSSESSKEARIILSNPKTKYAVLQQQIEQRVKEGDFLSIEYAINKLPDIDDASVLFSLAGHYCAKELDVEGVTYIGDLIMEKTGNPKKRGQVYAEAARASMDAAIALYQKGDHEAAFKYGAFAQTMINKADAPYGGPSGHAQNHCIKHALQAKLSSDDANIILTSLLNAKQAADPHPSAPVQVIHSDPVNPTTQERDTLWTRNQIALEAVRNGDIPSLLNLQRQLANEALYPEHQFSIINFAAQKFAEKGDLANALTMADLAEDNKGMREYTLGLAALKFAEIQEVDNCLQCISRIQKDPKNLNHKIQSILACFAKLDGKVGKHEFFNRIFTDLNLSEDDLNKILHSLSSAVN